MCVYELKTRSIGNSKSWTSIAEQRPVFCIQEGCLVCDQERKVHYLGTYLPR